MKKITNTIGFASLVVAILATCFVLTGGVQAVYGAIIGESSANKDRYVYYQLFAGTSTTPVATTTSATSTDRTAQFDDSGRLIDGTADLRGAKSVSFYFSRGDTTGVGNTGASVFSVEVTPDGTNWYDFNRLLGQDVSETATSSVTITAATSTVITHMDLDNQAYLKARCIVVETTDGEHTCAAYVEY